MTLDNFSWDRSGDKSPLRFFHHFFKNTSSLPKVYHFNFFISKELIIQVFFRFLQLQNIRKWRDAKSVF